MGGGGWEYREIDTNAEKTEFVFVRGSVCMGHNFSLFAGSPSVCIGMGAVGGVSH
jgi:hypothetical protein